MPHPQRRHGYFGPELFISPSVKGPWGVVSQLGGPPDPRGFAGEVLLRANALVREGMIALTRCEPRDLERAERCFQAALDDLVDRLPQPHPKVEYVLDRIGLTRQLNEDEAGAEAFYLRSVASLEARKEPPSIWNEITLMNLGILYGRQGREDEQRRILGLLPRDLAGES